MPHSWVVPVVPTGAVLENHSVVVHERRIVAILPTEEATAKYCAVTTVGAATFLHVKHSISGEEVFVAQEELGQHVLMPGLVNCHTHAPMALMAGVGDDMPLLEWLT